MFQNLAALIKLLDYLKGKKTYIVSVIIGIVAGLNAAGLITKELYDQINSVLYPLALAAVRAGMVNSKKAE